MSLLGEAVSSLPAVLTSPPKRRIDINPPTFPRSRQGGGLILRKNPRIGQKDTSPEKIMPSHQSAAQDPSRGRSGWDQLKAMRR